MGAGEGGGVGMGPVKGAERTWRGQRVGRGGEERGGGKKKEKKRKRKKKKES